MSNPTFITFLKQSSIFFKISPTQLELIANLCQEQVYQQGEIIFLEQGEGKELYVIAQGEVDIIINPVPVGNTSSDGHKEVRLVTLRRGQSFGEIALVDDGPRSATARATQNDTHLLLIPRDKIIMLCETYPQLGYRLMSNLAIDLAAKIRNSDQRLREQLLYKSPQK